SLAPNSLAPWAPSEVGGLEGNKCPQTSLPAGPPSSCGLRRRRPAAVHKPRASCVTQPARLGKGIEGKGIFVRYRAVELALYERWLRVLCGARRPLLFFSGLDLDVEFAQMARRDRSGRF